MMKVRKGFTLVELLIVIVIIGILAAAMLLSSASATASAEASNYVSELRNLKAACMMLYADSMDDFNTGTSIALSTTAAKSFLAQYMDNPEKINTSYLFGMTTAGFNGMKWFVGFDLSSATAEVKEKLAGKAKSVGLLTSTGSGVLPTSLTTPFTKGNSAVWMVAR